MVKFKFETEVGFSNFNSELYDLVRTKQETVTDDISLEVKFPEHYLDSHSELHDLAEMSDGYQVYD